MPFKIKINLNPVIQKSEMSLEEKIFMTRVAEQCEMYDDMVRFLADVIRLKTEDFTSEERNLLSSQIN